MRVDPRIDAIVDDNIPNGLRFEDTENCAYTDNTYKIIEYHRQRKEYLLCLRGMAQVCNRSKNCWSDYNQSNGYEVLNEKNQKVLF